MLVKIFRNASIKKERKNLKDQIVLRPNRFVWRRSGSGSGSVSASLHGSMYCTLMLGLFCAACGTWPAQIGDPVHGAQTEEREPTTDLLAYSLSIMLYLYSTFPRLFYLLDPYPFLYADPCGSGSETLVCSAGLYLLPVMGTRHIFAICHHTTTCWGFCDSNTVRHISGLKIIRKSVFNDNATSRCQQQSDDITTYGYCTFHSWNPCSGTAYCR